MRGVIRSERRKTHCRRDQWPVASVPGERIGGGGGGGGGFAAGQHTCLRDSGGECEVPSGGELLRVHSGASGWRKGRREGRACQPGRTAGQENSSAGSASAACYSAGRRASETQPKSAG